jgi:hypothetical protein
LCASPVVLGGLSKRARIQVGDPAFIETSAILGHDQPEQAERCLARNLIPLEQHLAEQRLRPVIPFVGCKIEPACRVNGVLVGSALAEQVEAPEIVLGLWIGKVKLAALASAALCRYCCKSI